MVTILAPNHFYMILINASQGISGHLISEPMHVTHETKKGNAAITQTSSQKKRDNRWALCKYMQAFML